jgi:hypothetical protein
MLQNYNGIEKQMVIGGRIAAFLVYSSNSAGVFIRKLR